MLLLASVLMLNSREKGYRVLVLQNVAFVTLALSSTSGCASSKGKPHVVCSFSDTMSGFSLQDRNALAQVDQQQRQRLP